MQSLSSFRTPPHRKTMGMELECYFPEYIEWEYFFGFWYSTTDRSIKSENNYGREFVSQPLTPEWLIKEIKRLPKILQTTWETNGSCGIHIHVSREWLTKKKANEIWGFLKTLWKNHPDIYEEAFGRKPNEYCRCDGALEGTRYKAINTLNASTIEFRMFASGGVEWAITCVKTAKYLVDHAHHLNIEAFSAFVESRNR